MPETLLTLDYKDWSKQPKRRRSDFGTFYGKRLLKGWSFLGMSVEAYEKKLAEHKETGNKWAASKNLPIQ